MDCDIRLKQPGLDKKNNLFSSKAENNHFFSNFRKPLVESNKYLTIDFFHDISQSTAVSLWCTCVQLNIFFRRPLAHSVSKISWVSKSMKSIYTECDILSFIRMLLSCFLFHDGFDVCCLCETFTAKQN